MLICDSIVFSLSRDERRRPGLDGSGRPASTAIVGDDRSARDRAERALGTLFLSLDVDGVVDVSAYIGSQNTTVT